MILTDILNLGENYTLSKYTTILHILLQTIKMEINDF